MKHLTVVLLDVISFFFLEEKSRIKLTVANKISVHRYLLKFPFFSNRILHRRGEKKVQIIRLYVSCKPGKYDWEGSAFWGKEYIEDTAVSISLRCRFKCHFMIILTIVTRRLRAQKRNAKALVQLLLR